MSFENDAYSKSYKQYFLPTIEIEDYNVMICGRNFIDQPVKKDQKTHDDIWKIAIGERDDYTIGCLVHYLYFKNYYKMIAIDLSK